MADQPGRLGSRLPSLTGLRFIAALSVFGFHIYVVGMFGGTTNHVLARLLGPGGGVGVSFFFVLSGFVLTWSLRDVDTPRRFWRRRFVKIYPSHLVVSALVLAILLGASMAPAVSDTIPPLLLIQSWVPKTSVYFGLNSPSWSLACEAFFYLSFPLLWRWISRIRPERLWPTAIGVMAAVWCVPAISLLLPSSPAAPPPIHHMTQAQFWFVYIFPVTRMLEFVLGIVLARVVREGRWIGLGMWPATALVVVAYFAAGFTPAPIGLVAVSVVPLALLVPAVATADITGGRSPWRSRVMIWLGETSFGFYLIHQVVIDSGHATIAGGKSHPLLPALGLTLLFLVIALVEARLLYVLVERWCMRRFAMSRRDRAARLAASVASRPDPAVSPAAEAAAPAVP
jgi:peptidoglycan/LPS O-acetylase OafA/YrhL